MLASSGEPQREPCVGHVEARSVLSGAGLSQASRRSHGTLGYSYSKSISYLRTTTRALIRVRRANIRCRKVVYPLGVHGKAR